MLELLMKGRMGKCRIISQSYVSALFAILWIVAAAPPARTQTGFCTLYHGTAIETSQTFKATLSEQGDNTSATGTYVVVETGQEKCYNNIGEISCPQPDEAFYGQDANYSGHTPSYVDNGDGTVTDLVTGLMWQKSPDTNGDGVIDYDDKLTYYQAIDGAASCNTGGYSDWRLPTIKELYSLIMFYGVEPNPNAPSPAGCIPFIDTSNFDFGYGDLSARERIIDAQYASSTLYVSTTMGGEQTMFGVNFADGRIKGYPSDTNIVVPTMEMRFYVLNVRDNTVYGTNQFVDNGDGTITDNATGLMWMKNDNGAGFLWENALSYAEGIEYAGYTDWRLPNAKELQSIVDYTRSPTTTSSAAIDTMFNCTSFFNEAGETDYPFYWSSTSHGPSSAAYISFGRAMGYMPIYGGWVDVHGAGAQRSDPKAGNPADFPYGRGPQGDAIRIYNYVRCVRTGILTSVREDEGGALPASFALLQNYPNPFNPVTTIEYSVPSRTDVTIEIFNVLGQRVRTLVNETKSAGSYRIEWNGSGDAGRSVSTGVYLYRFQAGDIVQSKKMLLLK